MRAANAEPQPTKEKLAAILAELTPATTATSSRRE
jgi:hypothetical protein